jgi:two-component system, NarL family, captular synthesis response regulator RcsB
MGSLRVISADNHPFVIPGIRSALSKQRDILIAEEAPSSSALIRLLQTVPCNVLIIDLTMPSAGNAMRDGAQLVGCVHTGISEQSYVCEIQNV